jgi:hypothetical protein
MEMPNGGKATMRLLADDYRLLRLLRLGPFERRPRGGWRFGTKVISDRKVARLVASGRVRESETQVILVDRMLRRRRVS